MRYIKLTLLALLIASTLLVGWKHSDAKVLSNDTTTILEMSKPLLQADFRLHMKWSGKGKGYTSLIDFETYNNTIIQRLGIPSSDPLESVNGLPVLRSLSLLTDGAQLQSMLVGSKDQNTTMSILNLLAAPPMTLEQMVQTQSILEQKLTSLGLKGSWTIMVQGALNETEIGEHPEGFIHKISDQIEGTEQEIYREEHTVSISFLSNKIQTAKAVQSGNHKVNLQIALHQNSTTKVWRLTMGVPLITMEY
jgi:hypothetical protein